MPLGSVPMRTAASVGNGAERANESRGAIDAVPWAAATVAVMTAASTPTDRLLKKLNEFSSW